MKYLKLRKKNDKHLYYGTFLLDDELIFCQFGSLRQLPDSIDDLKYVRVW